MENYFDKIYMDYRQQGAKILINNTYPLRAAIDGYLAHFMINKGVLKEVYISSKNYGINGSIKKHYKTTI